MDKLIPFFSYDIMSRMIPGGVTLALFGYLRGRLPEPWASLFTGVQSWKAIVVPLTLGATAYVIGVCYECIDYSSPLRRLILAADNAAFCSAWSTFCNKSNKDASGKVSQQLEVSSLCLWERLVFKGGQDRGQSSVFAHCHRFQAEYKMFLHLIYPTILFVVFALCRHKLLLGTIALGIIVPVFFYFGYQRNERRWLQAIYSGKELGLLEPEVTCAPQNGV